MLDKVRPCPVCGGEMNYRLGEYICSACDHTETAFAQLLEEEVELLEKPEAATPSQPVPDSTVAEDMARATDAGYVLPQLPPASVGPTAFMRSGAGVGLSVASSKALYREKLACLVAYAVIMLFGAVTSYITLPQVIEQFYAGLQQNLDDSALLLPSLDLYAHAGAIIAMAGLYILVQLFVAWWILFKAAAWMKWCTIGCAVLAVLGSLSTTPWLVLAALPGVSRTPLLLAEVLQIAWQAWIAMLLYRDIRSR